MHNIISCFFTFFLFIWKFAENENIAFLRVKYIVRYLLFCPLFWASSCPSNIKTLFNALSKTPKKQIYAFIRKSQNTSNRKFLNRGNEFRCFTFPYIIGLSQSRKVIHLANIIQVTKAISISIYEELNNVRSYRF